MTGPNLLKQSPLINTTLANFCPPGCLNCAEGSKARGLTLDQISVHPAPGVTVLGGEDADGLNVAGQGRATDLVQLMAELLSHQRSSVTAVHLQSEELKHTAQEDSLL